MKINLGKYQINITLNKNNIKSKKINGQLLDTITTLEFVSHELKGVLGSTIMCAYAIRDGFLGLLNFKQRATIETIIRNLKRLEATIKDFLDISKIEDGNLNIKKVKVDINKDIIKEIEDSYISELYDKRIKITNNIPENLVINTDRSLFLTVFNNLISNAIKYGNAGGQIVLSYNKIKNMHRFSVFNSGTPISNNDKDKLFKKFSRIENEQNKKVKGTGLGLFIVKTILKNLDGDIWLETSENGNNFIFELKEE